MKKYLKNALSKNQTPQRQPIPGTKQVPNSAGGYSWQVDAWQRLRRFLILGSEGGSYYSSQGKLTLDNAQNLLHCLQVNGLKTVQEIVTLSDSGRAPKNDPAIFALAVAASHGDDETRRAALSALPQVCRTATHLFGFAEYVKGMRGWGRGLRRAIGGWYTGKPARTLAYQLVKYRQRNGWTHVDTLRLAHPVPPDETYKQLFHWATRRELTEWVYDPAEPEDEAQAFVWAFEKAHQAKEVSTILKLIERFDLPREAIPTEFLKQPQIWEALLDQMPMTAMIRNLGTMSRVGLLTALSDAEHTIAERLTDAERLHKARIHPIALLSALRVYAYGRSLRGRAPQMWGYGHGYYDDSEPEWQPTQRVMDALDAAFELAFEAIEPTNKRTMLALDVSGSMGWGMIAGVPGLTPREGSAAMAMVTARREPQYMFTAFSHKMRKIDISAKMRLDTVINTIEQIPMGGTDCALPMQYALKERIPVDTFTIYTDNETWYGEMHPMQALRQYRDAMGIPARLIVVGMVANRFSIADPDDAGMMDVVGFDSAAPQVMADFARGEL